MGGGGGGGLLEVDESPSEPLTKRCHRRNPGTTSVTSPNHADIRHCMFLFILHLLWTIIQIQCEKMATMLIKQTVLFGFLSFPRSVLYTACLQSYTIPY